MLLVPGGEERSEDEYRALLAKAGFRLTRVVPDSNVGQPDRGGPCLTTKERARQLRPRLRYWMRAARHVGLPLAGLESSPLAGLESRRLRAGTSGLRHPFRFPLLVGVCIEQ